MPVLISPISFTGIQITDIVITKPAIWPINHGCFQRKLVLI